MSPIWCASAPKGLAVSVGALSFIASLVFALVDPRTANWVTVAFTAGLFGPTILAFSRYRIEVFEDRVRYRSPLGGTRELTFEHIAESRVNVGNGAFKPEYSLVVIPHTQTSKASIYIAISVFRPADISRLTEFPGLRYTGEEPSILAGA